MISEPPNDDENGRASNLDEGGTGGESEYPISAPTRVERIERQALAEQWPVPTKEVKQQIVNRQSMIAMNPTSTKREATSSFRALLQMDLVNLAAAPPIQTHAHAHAFIPVDERAAVIVEAIDAELSEREPGASDRNGLKDGNGNGEP